jgi:hypothetical protein
MQFQVPQFIDIEDKVIGPLTIKQFLYLLVAGIIIFILYKILNLFATIILSIPIIGIAIAIAFVKIGDQPFSNLIKNFFSFIRKPDFYVWKKPIGKIEEKTPEIIKKAPANTKQKPIAKDNLQDMGWKVEINKE